MYPSRYVTFITAIMNSLVLYVNWSIDLGNIVDCLSRLHPRMLVLDSCLLSNNH